MTKAIFYKQRKHRMLAGVVAGLADKYSWDLTIARILAALFVYFSGVGLLLYILLAIFLPYKEDLQKEDQKKAHYYYQSGSRQRKDAEVIDDDDQNQSSDKWFW